MSARIGNLRTDAWQSRSAVEDNLAAAKIEIPANGWIPSIGVHAGGYANATRANMCVWRVDASVTPLVYFSEKQGWNEGRDWRYAYPSSRAIQAMKGQQYWVGYVTDRSAGHQYSYLPSSKNMRVERSVGSVPTNLSPYSAAANEPTAFVTFVPNQAPLQGLWLGVTPSGTITDDTPLFAGTIEHHEDEQLYDSTSLVHLQIYRADTGAMLYNEVFEPSAGEIYNGYFQRTPYTLPFGVPCRARYRHADQYSVWSPWSQVRSFTYGQGPNKPVVTAPIGKLNVVSGHNYTGTYSHPQGVSSNALQIQVMNKLGTAVLYDSGVVAKTVATGGSWSHAAWHQALKLGGEYAARARLRDTANSWSAWSTLALFNVNAKPYMPGKLSPSGGATTSSAVLSAEVADPDGDQITLVRLDLIDAATNASVPTFPKVVGSVGSGKWTYNAAPDLTFGKDYKWRIQAYDGFVYGDYSSWMSFSYRQIPSVVLKYPSLQGLKNLVARPSAEYETAMEWWTDSAETSTAFIERINDGDAAFGEYAWRGVSDNTTTNPYRRSPKVPVNTATQYVLVGQFKKDNSTLPASTTFRLRCFDAAGAFLGNVYPASAGALSQSDITPYWSDYGGTIYDDPSGGGPKFPAGTTQVEIEIIPVHLGAAGPASSVRFDAIDLIPLPTPISALNWPQLQHWFGYFDGDTTGYRTSNAEEYYWEGLPGESVSYGLHVLENPAPSVLISYSSPTNSAKKNDRIYIEGWSEVTQSFTQVYDSGWQGGSRTAIPLPGNVLGNQKRYRMQVAVQDSSTPPLVAYTDWVSFDVRVPGPPELNIMDIFGDASVATITLRHDQTTLGVTAFGGIEIGVEPEGEPMRVYTLITDPQSTEVLYPFPESGKSTNYYVRQIEHRETGDVASRWVRQTFTLDYYPRFFLKDVDDPFNIVAAWTPHPGAIPSRESQREMHEFVPWGARAPVHLFSEPGYESGTLQVWLRPDPNIETTPEERLLAIESMDERRRTLCLMMNAPKLKRFVAATKFSYSVNELEEVLVDMDWVEDNYSEDYYVREVMDGS